MNPKANSASPASVSAGQSPASDLQSTDDAIIVLADRPDYFLFGVFVLIWLLPITWVGLTKRSVPVVGLYANDMYRVASLFTTRLQGSVEYYFQFQDEEDIWDWQNLDKEDYGSIIMSGNRTRLDRMLQDSISSHRGMRQRQRLAEYIKTHYEKRNPDKPKMTAFRYQVVFFPVGEKMASQVGRWREYPLEKLPQEQVRELSVHYFDGRPGKNTLIENMKVEASQSTKGSPESDLE
ncbi:MAG: hypothetical protein KDB27_11600 [Planctomycetales bacterium]|nr:hypothetical protein [Planctomycetales bacterium]